ncbi:family 43 glycosylhydrolase [Kribbella solani]|uniref:family 43 glycosylhydrolase n=1 Tax=Kribbella solani TaxID=236067 RepID=UPI0029A76A92|nr:family 43 glycosylhydrolase [Kribbella solani]MDX2968914.1 family 43 glycosylhydrolase [Kribbella solani]
MPSKRLLAAALTVVAVAAGTTAAQAAPDPVVKTTNPITSGFADTFADPSIIQGRDGYWYAYATSDPLVANGPFGLMHMARTKDFSSWEYLGTVFNDQTKPSWAAPGSFFWAPDIRYFGGKYVMYFTVTDTLANPGGDPAIGVATAPAPAGPWTATDGPVVTPKPDGNGGYYGTIDPAMLTAADGKRYLYYGGFYGGISVTELSPDGMHAVGTPTQVTIGDRYEGSYVVYRDGWYYFMGSSMNCCAGPTTGYSVFAGRSRSPKGPFLDADGVALTDSRVGGTTVITQNGNKWIGPGHHAFMTDAAGQDHIVYHAIDRRTPWLTDPFGINRRPMLIDKIDWIDGWPRTRAGLGPSEGPVPAPATGSALGIDSTDPAGGLIGATRQPGDAVGGATAKIARAAQTRQTAPGGSLRVEADGRLGSSFATVLGNHVVARVVGNRLTLAAGRRTTSVNLPADFDRTQWNKLVVQVTESSVTARLNDAGLGDVYAEAQLPGVRLAAAPVRWIGSAEVDNLTVRSVAKAVTKPADVPRTGKVLAGDDFDGSLGAGWSWVRKDAKATVADGKLSWPLENADLVGTGNNAGLLLHDSPAGDKWIAETELHLDTGQGDVRNYQQAGLIAYLNDNDFARLGNVSIWKTRQTEYGRELVARPSDGATSYGAAAIGRSAPTLWMRLAYQKNAAGEHVYQAGTSVDGKNWTWGAAWVLPAAARIGLYAHGEFTGANPPPVATFDYLKFYESK